MNFQIQSWPSPEIFIAALKKAFTKTFVSSLPGAIWATSNVIPHGFGSRPSCCGAYLACIITDTATGYTSGDFVDADDVWDVNGLTGACDVYMNATSVGLVTSDLSGVGLIPKTGGSSPVQMTSVTNFKVVVWAIQF